MGEGGIPSVSLEEEIVRIVLISEERNSSVIKCKLINFGHNIK